jgi:Kdo2-lipid IVA lauroyltransferase/acyltransferase
MNRRLGQRVKNHLIFALVMVLIVVLRRTPRSWVGPVGWIIGRWAWLCGIKERRRALSNVARVFPQLVARSRSHMVQQMFVQLGQSALECMMLPRWRPHLWDEELVSFAPGSLALLRDALSERRGVVFVTAHLGNWELMAAKVACLAPVHVLFKPSYDPRFTRLMEQFRQGNGVQGIDVTHPGHLRLAVKALRRGEIVGILLDQPVDQGASFPFLGHLASTSTLAARLAHREKAVTIAGFCYRERPCQHAIFLRRVGTERGPFCPKAVTRQLSSTVEEAIFRDPAQWVWSLDRWRSADQDGLSSRLSSRSSTTASVVPAGNN